MNEAPEDMHEVADSAPDKRPWQYSLRSLFVLTTICAVLCSLATSLGPFSLLFPLLLLPAWDSMREHRPTGRSRQPKESRTKVTQE